jgi:hypothetical protein
VHRFSISGFFSGVGLRLLLDMNSDLVVTEVTPGGGCEDTRMVQPCFHFNDKKCNPGTLSFI